MSKRPFMPRTDLGRLSWINNLAVKLPLHADKYAVSADDVNDVKAGALYFAFWLGYTQHSEDAQRKLVQYKNELIDGIPPGATASVQPSPVSMIDVPPSVEPGIFKRASAIANGIKSKSSYTIADGNDLGIEGVEITGDLQDLKPLLTLRLVAGGRPEVKWIKKSIDGIEIYVDRGEGWLLLAFDTHPGYIDNAPLPAAGSSVVWKYKAIYRHGDGQVGHWSAVSEIMVKG